METVWNAAKFFVKGLLDFAAYTIMAFVVMYALGVIVYEVFIKTRARRKDNGRGSRLDM